jgi:hypothetical protein
LPRYSKTAELAGVADIACSAAGKPGSLRSYELVLTAYPKIWSATPEGNRQAIALLREAIAIDPDYGRAHALIAWCHAQDVDYLWSSDPEADRARWPRSPKPLGR